MKKLLALLIVAVLLLSGCTNDNNGDDDNNGNGNGDETTVLKVGTASYTSVSRRDFVEGTDGRVQVNTYYATVALDEDGKFVFVDIDTAQNQGTFDGAGVVLAAEAAPTKKEKGPDYGMVGNSEIGKEWFEQIAVLEEYMIGQTLAEVLATPVEERDPAHPSVPSDEDLASKVTITIEGYLKVVEKAVENAVEVEGIAKLGSGSYTKVSGRDFVEGTDGRVQVNVTYAGVGLDADGKIIYVYIDTAQNQGTFDGAGAVLAADPAPTKKEKGPDYGMVGNSEIGKEWFEQMESLEEHMTGMTPAEVKAIPTEEKDAAHPAVPADEDLKSSVSIDISAYQGAVDKAAANAIDLP